MAALSFDDLVAAVHTAATDHTPIALLESASHVSSALTDHGEALLDHFVTRCRSEGHSWSQIGTALGVSKQAAQRRFVDSSHHRLTPRTRKVLDAAREIADDQGASAVRLDHLVIAVFSEPDTIAAKVLHDLEVEREELTDAIAKRTARPGARLSQAPPAEQLVLAAALECGHNYIGTEHVLLACHRDQNAAIARALDDVGATREQLSERVLAHLQK